MDIDSFTSKCPLTQDNGISISKFTPPEEEKTYYKDTNEYYSSISKLIADEYDKENSLRSNMTQRNISIKWDLTSNPKMVRFTYIHKKITYNQEESIDVGDTITLSRDRTEIRFYIYRTPDIFTDEYGAECKKGFIRNLNLLTSYNSGFTIEYSTGNFIYQRRCDALLKFIHHETNNSISNYLASKILGHSIEDSFTCYDKYFTSIQPPNLPLLDSSQKVALKESITNSLHLIHGPPGTGKTITLAAIIFNLIKLKDCSKVLVCAASNKAVDNLAKRIYSTGLNVVRLYSMKQELYGSVINEISLNAKVEELINYSEKNLLNYIEILPEMKIRREEMRLPYVRQIIQNKLLDLAQVICCPCTELANRLFESKKFDLVIFDESTQALEADCLIALTKGCNHLIMVGDHCQLGPVIKTSDSLKNHLRLSLFERLYYNNNSFSQLKTQYRMHPSISKFPSYAFYSNQITDCYTPLSSKYKILYGTYFEWPNLNKPVIFFAHNYPEDPLKSLNHSHSNKYEADQLVDVLTRLIKIGFTSSQIGVITFYGHQRKIIQEKLRNQNIIKEQNLIDLEVASVDSFQGREKDIIIVSCVRSNYSDGIGFLSDPRRLNVSITRAKHGLIILGNVECLRKDKIWSDLIEYYLKNDLIFYGSFDKLKNYKDLDQIIDKEELSSYLK